MKKFIVVSMILLLPVSMLGCATDLNPPIWPASTKYGKERKNSFRQEELLYQAYLNEEKTAIREGLPERPVAPFHTSNPATVILKNLDPNYVVHGWVYNPRDPDKQGIDFSLKPGEVIVFPSHQPEAPHFRHSVDYTIEYWRATKNGRRLQWNGRPIFELDEMPVRTKPSWDSDLKIWYNGIVKFIPIRN